MQCPSCHTLLDDDTIFCGNCGKQIRPQQAVGATLNMPPGGQVGERVHNSPGDNSPTVLSNNRSNPFTPSPPVYGQTPPPYSPAPSQQRPRWRMPIIAAILLLVVAGGIVLTLAIVQRSNTGATNATGQVSFLDGAGETGNTDALKISITGLSAPASGSQYNAWLLNTETEQFSPLGVLKATSATNFALNFASPGTSAQAGVNLLSLGNQVVVTLEHGQVKLPAGPTVLSATFPPRAFVHIKHLLFSFPTTPGKIGLLVGLFKQTQLLSAQAQVMQGSAANQNAGILQCVAQSILDIIEGRAGPHYRPLSSSCGSTTAIGDGFGILGTNGYASTAAAHAALAATQTDSTDVIRLHAKEVEIATSNITKWVTTIQRDALTLLNGQVNHTAINEIATLAEKAQIGFDANGDGQIEPVADEAGAITAYLRGQLMATLPMSHS